MWSIFLTATKKLLNSDYIVAFIPDGYKSNGTLDTIAHAEKLNKKVVILD